ncbi:MAG: multidrug ABC transporter ATP-binding protein, partial [Haliea sp.]
PPELEAASLELIAGGHELVYTFDAQHEQTGIADLLRQLASHQIEFKDLHSSQSSLEDIFVNLVRPRS